MSYSKILSLSCIGGLTFSLCVNAQQGQRKWRYVAAPSTQELGGMLVDPNRGNRAALCSWVDEDEHTTTLLVGVKDKDGATINKIIYSLTQPDTMINEKTNIQLKGLIPRNIFRSPEKVLYLAANNGKSGVAARGEVWVSINGQNWLKLGDYRNDGHITFSVKTIGGNETTVVQVKMPGTESTDIITTDDEINLKEYLRKKHKSIAASQNDNSPKQLSSTNKWFIGITTTNSEPESAESIGENLVSPQGIISQEVPILSGYQVKTKIDDQVLNDCMHAINRSSPDLAEICSKVQDNTNCTKTYNNNKEKINELEESKQDINRHITDLLSLEADNTLNWFNFFGHVSTRTEQIDALATLDNHQSNNKKDTNDALTKFKSISAVLLDDFNNRRDYDTLSKQKSNIDLKLYKQQQIIYQIDNQQEKLRIADKKACDQAPKPEYIDRLNRTLIGDQNRHNNYDSCVVTYDNSGFIASRYQENNNYLSELHTCGKVTEVNLPKYIGQYDQPQEVIAQNNGSIAIVNNGNEIKITNNVKASSSDCQKVDYTAFGPCSINRVMITGIHPTLAWSHSDTATITASKRYNGIFLALGQTPTTRSDNRLGVYLTPIDIEATRECHKKSKVINLGGTLTGEPAAKVIWWWQKEDSKGSFQNIEATKTESNKEETIEIKSYATNQNITVYIGEFDENGKKQIPTYTTNSTGKYRLMASTVIGGFLCDRNNNDSEIISSYHEAIGSPTAVIEVTDKCIEPIKVKNKQSDDSNTCFLTDNSDATDRKRTH